MNKKYKPGIYFGIYTTVMSFFIPFIIHLSPGNKYNIGVLIIASVIGGYCRWQYFWVDMEHVQEASNPEFVTG